MYRITGGEITPDAGDVLIDGVSIRSDPNTARVGLGVCPQFTAIDSQLTVREHLVCYGRLKGLHGAKLERNVVALIQVCF